MCKPEDARQQEMQRVIEEGLQEDLLRCTSCGQPECLGLCENAPGPDTEALSVEPNSHFWLTDEGHYPPGM